MKKFFNKSVDVYNKAKYVISGEDGASNMELIIWFSVVLCIGTVLFLLKDHILQFINKVIGKVDGLQVE